VLQLPLLLICTLVCSWVVVCMCTGSCGCWMPARAGCVERVLLLLPLQQAS
jgi:hypothetical protein